jgi:NADH pyrophosphatase NudC (nudix superfamily)
MQPFEIMRFCPRCGAKSNAPASIPFVCGACRLKLYFNAAVSVSAFVFDLENRLLLIRRGKEPAKGMLATIGGFVDIGESAENALKRELREEIGAEVRDVRFITSSPNLYAYGDITYPVLDLFFACELVEGTQITAHEEEVGGLEWCSTEEVDPGSLAFDSMRVAFKMLHSVRGPSK